MNGEHSYSLRVEWTGNSGEGTSNYKLYERSYTIIVDNKPDILASADPAFRGDKTKHNPEDFLVAALSSCHMLSYLHLCAVSGVIVTDYIDNATGIMIDTLNGRGHFSEVTLNPSVTVSENSMIEKANELHKKANELCFIANSVNFAVHHKPSCKIKDND